MNNRILKSLYSLLILGSLVGCTPDPVDPGEPTIEESYELGWNTSYLMKDTLLETPVYVYKSETPGPRVTIVGGIHGDEIAGWKTAETLLNRTDLVGTVMVIPYANILACAAIQRYPGIGYGGYLNSTYIANIRSSSLMEGKTYTDAQLEAIKFYDLNRVFPGDPNGSETLMLANELYNKVIGFEPNYCVDLHESRHNYTQSKKNDTTYLGSSLIYGNALGSVACNSLIADYNAQYADGSTYIEFTSICGTSAASASDPDYDYRFVKQVGLTLNKKKSRVLTIETNRECTNNKYNTSDGRELEYRLNEQKHLVDLILTHAKADYDAGKFN